MGAACAGCAADRVCSRHPRSRPFEGESPLRRVQACAPRHGDLERPATSTTLLAICCAHPARACWERVASGGRCIAGFRLGRWGRLVELRRRESLSVRSLPMLSCLLSPRHRPRGTGAQGWVPSHLGHGSERLSDEMLVSRNRCGSSACGVVRLRDRRFVMGSRLPALGKGVCSWCFLFVFIFPRRNAVCTPKSCLGLAARASLD